MNQSESGPPSKEPSRNVKQSPTAIKSEDPKGDCQTTTSERCKEKKNWPQRVEAVCAILLVFITGLYTHYSRKQAIAATAASQAATDSLNTIKEQFQMDQRPHISVKDITLMDTNTGKRGRPVFGKPLVVSFVFKNVGKSEALNTFIHRHILFGPQLSQFKIEPADQTRMGSVIDPGGDGLTTAVSIADTFGNESAQITPSEMINWDGSEPIVLFGRISYEDTFGNLYCIPYATKYLATGYWLDLESLNGHHIREMCPFGKP